MKVSIKTITPAIAMKMLEKNKGNRKFNERNAGYITSAMRRGKFRENGESIIFSVDDRLLDGQHRLTGVVNSGKTYDFVVVEGVQGDSFDSIDTGRTRTAGDVLGSQGIPSSSQVGAMARFILNFRGGNFSDASKSTKSAASSNAEILKFAKQNKELIELYNYCQGINSVFRYLSAASLAALYFLFQEIDEKKAEKFFISYKDGVNLGIDHPIRLLRDKLIREQNKKMPIRSKIALFVIAWNAFRKNKPLTQLKFEAEDVFPKLQ